MIYLSRVGFFPSKTCFFRTKWKKLDKTCFDQFLPSKTVQNRPKLDEIMDSLVKMVISLNQWITFQQVKAKQKTTANAPKIRSGASTTWVQYVLPKMINMNIHELKTLYSNTTRVLIFRYLYSYVQYSPQPCLKYPIVQTMGHFSFTKSLH